MVDALVVKGWSVAAPLIVATLRTCADDLERTTVLSDGCGVPPEWMEDGT